MKDIFIFCLGVIMLALMVECDHKDPERKIIEENLHIITLQGEVALLKKGFLVNDDGSVEIQGSDEVIVKKNFVAYALYNDTVILCEEKDDAQIFWTYEIETETLNEHETYSDLCDFCLCKEFEWEPLWVEEFNLKK